MSEILKETQGNLSAAQVLERFELMQNSNELPSNYTRLKTSPNNHIRKDSIYYEAGYALPTVNLFHFPVNTSGGDAHPEDAADLIERLEAIVNEQLSLKLEERKPLHVLLDLRHAKNAATGVQVFAGILAPKAQLASKIASGQEFVIPGQVLEHVSKLGTFTFCLNYNDFKQSAFQPLQALILIKAAVKQGASESAFHVASPKTTPLAWAKSKLKSEPTAAPTQEQ